MLVLSRKPDESILIDGGIRVTVLGMRGNQLRLGIEAPADVKIIRGELSAEGDSGGSRREPPHFRTLAVAFSKVSRRHLQVEH